MNYSKESWDKKPGVVGQVKNKTFHYLSALLAICLVVTLITTATFYYTCREKDMSRVGAQITTIVDTDNDTVSDTVDKCPDTQSGMAVDETGCPISPVVGQGNFFSLNGISIKASKDITVMNFKADQDAVECNIFPSGEGTVSLTFSGLKPNTTYTSYDNRRDVKSVTTNAEGSYTTELDLTQSHNLYLTTGVSS